MPIILTVYHAFTLAAGDTVQDGSMNIWRCVVATTAASIFVVPILGHDVSAEIDQIAWLMKLAPGMQLADVGAGDGVFAEALAGRVGPSGQVFINEIDDGELKRIRERLARTERTNLTVVAGETDDARLPNECCDGILVRMAYHHMNERDAMRASLRRSLRPDGLLVIVEKLEANGHGIALDDVIDELTGDGFQLISRHPDWGGHEGHHAAVFGLAK
jgi:SAM-dependent methyltransferase